MCFVNKNSCSSELISFRLYFVAGDKIPGGATLVFDVELLQILEGHKPQNVFDEIDTDKDDLLSQDEVCFLG